MNALRSGLPELPARIKALPVDDRGYPVPWFVAWIDGKPDFRVADGEKMPLAIKNHLCWICGQRLGTYLAFLIGPMCAVTRTISEPPSHRECAEFAARACPFLVRPNAKRREAGITEGLESGELEPAAGLGLKRNPGVALVWITKWYRFSQMSGGFLFSIGDPVELHSFAGGRQATPEEIEESVVSGLPSLVELAENDPRDPHGAVRELAARITASSKLLGIAEPQIVHTLALDQPAARRRMPLPALVAAAAIMGAVSGKGR